MASTFSASAAAASSSAIVGAEVPTTKILSRAHLYSHSKVFFFFFCVSPKPKLRLFSKPLSSRTVAAKAQLNKVAVDGSNNSAASPEAKSGVPAQEEKNDERSKESLVASEESISEFVNQVASLVKLVDSRDIAELQMKQLGCEILIRKKEAIPQAQNPAPMVMMQPPPPVASSASGVPSLPSAPALPAPAAPAVKSAKSSHPPLLSPMAGTFYRSPAPGEPAFVKVGDKVQKGQVLCIIEAMKLMNEIQAEQAGTVIEIVAEDAKPVSKDSPLFVIQP